MTGMPHRPSSTDGQSSLSLLIAFRSSSFHPIGLSAKTARRLRSPYRVRLAARTVRQLEAL
jgi:hypothetical protein